MMIRCGSCRTQFEVPGEGRFSCPACGSVNLVRGPAGAGAPPPGPAPGPAPGAGGSGPPPNTGAMPPTQPGMAGQPQPVPQPPPDVPAPRITCDDCGFTFIVGDIAVATCPNCGAEVETGFDEDE